MLTEIGDFALSGENFFESLDALSGKVTGWTPLGIESGSIEGKGDFEYGLVSGPNGLEASGTFEFRED